MSLRPSPRSRYAHRGNGTVSSVPSMCREINVTNSLEDASLAWCRAGWTRAIHRHVFMSCMAMFVLSLYPAFPTILIAKQLMWCKVRICWQSQNIPSIPLLMILQFRLCNHAQSYAVHLDAKSLQSSLSWRRARDVSYLEGRCSSTNRLSMLLRIDILQHFGVGSIPWSPLARGLLTRPLVSDTNTTRAKTDLFVSIPHLSSQRARVFAIDIRVIIYLFSTLNLNVFLTLPWIK